MQPQPFEFREIRPVNEVSQFSGLVRWVFALDEGQRQAGKDIQTPVIRMDILGVRVNDQVRFISLQDGSQIRQVISTSINRLRVLRNRIRAFHTAIVR